MSAVQSVSEWITSLKEGHHDAAQHLWERYSNRLIELARQQLKNLPKQASDEDDVVASVFQSLCRGAAAGRFQNVSSRDELWWLLLAITKRKVIDHFRRETARKRGMGRIKNESALQANGVGKDEFSLDLLISDEPTPEFIAMLQEQQTRLLGLLRDDKLRQIAESRIEGYTIPEIADELGVCSRSIQRKLQVIRIVWSEELKV